VTARLVGISQSKNGLWVTGTDSEDGEVILQFNFGSGRYSVPVSAYDVDEVVNLISKLFQPLSENSCYRKMLFSVPGTVKEISEVA